jgi:hypothetical protein
MESSHKFFNQLRRHQSFPEAIEDQTLEGYATDALTIGTGWRI